MINFILKIIGRSKMDIFIVCSKYFYERIPKIKQELEQNGHRVTLPNSYEDPFLEERMKKRSSKEYIKFKEKMFRLQEKKIKNNEALLVLNLEKNGEKNYIGGSTFLEMYDAWKLSKKLFMYNPIPDNLLKDEITGFNPQIIYGDISKIK